MKLEPIGAHLRKCRTGKAIGLAELARRIGVSHTFLSLIELGQRMPPTQILKAYSEHLDADYDVLCYHARRIPDDLLEQILESPASIGRVRRFMASHQTEDDDMNAFDEHDEDIKLIEDLLDTGEQLRDTQREDMEDILDRLQSGNLIKLTPKQRQYVKKLRAKAGLDDKSENIFSSLSPDEQARQRAAAAAVKLPWEK